MEYEKVEVNSERWLDLEPLKNEVWRDIQGYEGLYQISNYGRVKRIVKYKNEYCKYYIPLLKTDKILKCINNSNGYNCVCLCKNNKSKRIYIHLLVANNFLDRNNFKYMPYENISEINIDKLEVNHKDEKTNNNIVENLEFCTSKYNANYGNRNKKMKEKQTKKYGKRVIQYDTNNNIIKKYQSIAEVSQHLNVSHTAIYLCCRGINKTCRGYILKYE